VDGCGLADHKAILHQLPDVLPCCAKEAKQQRNKEQQQDRNLFGAMRRMQQGCRACMKLRESVCRLFDDHTMLKRLQDRIKFNRHECAAAASAAVLELPRRHVLL
jgi:hypothetical protein